MTPSLSAVLIAKDEERDLPGCLESLKGLVSEIVVVVSEDTADRTAAVAEAAGAKVLRRTFDDYARQRQASLDAASGEWCLWIDPDERVTPELSSQIRSALSGSPSSSARPLFWAGARWKSSMRRRTCADTFARRSRPALSGRCWWIAFSKMPQRSMWTASPTDSSA